MAIAQGVAAWIVLKFVIACTDEAGANLARLMILQRSFVRELSAACCPREKSYFNGVVILHGLRSKGGENV